jgi:YD repeat-containing protein
VKISNNCEDFVKKGRLQSKKRKSLLIFRHVFIRMNNRPMIYPQKKLRVCFTVFAYFIFLTAFGTRVYAYPDITDDWFAVDTLVSSLTVYEKNTMAKDASLHSEAVLRGTASFDSKTGEKTNKKLYDETGDFQWENRYEYDARGNLTEWSSYNDRGRLNWKYKYSYNDDGRLERVVQLNGAEKIDNTTIYQYADDRLLEKSEYNSAGNLQWSKKYVYHGDGIIEWSTFYPDGTRIKKVREIYNTEQVKIREIHSDELGTIFEDVHFVYNDEKQITELRIYDGFGRVKEVRKMAYGLHGHLVRLKKDFYFEDRAAEHLITYQFDSRSNWTEKTTKHFVSNDAGDRALVSTSQVFREIEYNDTAEKK